MMDGMGWNVHDEMRNHAGEEAGRRHEESYQIRRRKDDCPDRRKEYVAYSATGAQSWEVVICVVFGCYIGG